jgi:hypothetical protein
MSKKPGTAMGGAVDNSDEVVGKSDSFAAWDVLSC